MSDCGCEADEFAALAEVEDEGPVDLAPDPRGTKVRVFRDQLLAPYAKPTGDKRRFRTGALTAGELPIGVKWQREDNQGHSTSVTVGAIHKIRFGDDGVYGSGVIFDPDPDKTKRWAEDCAEAYGLLKEKVIGPSVDLDDMDFHEYVVAEGEDFAAEARPEIEVDRGRIRAVTLVQIPAFVEARPFALDEIDADAYAAEQDAVAALTASGVYTHAEDTPVARDVEWDVLEWLTASVDEEGAALYDGPDGPVFPVATMVDGKLSLVPTAVADAVSIMAFQSDQLDLDEGVKQVMRERLSDLSIMCDLPLPPWETETSLVAAASSGWIPPADAFEDPKFTELTPITVRDGRVFGHLASWRSCHIGFKHCVKAPPSRSNYAHFHVGEIETDRGPLAVGKVTFGGGHAPTTPGITFQAAAEHYDDAGTAVAAVRAGEDKFGIWVAGVALPGQEDKFAALPLFPLSGDWRTVGGHMELVAALAVNTPGFPIPRVSERSGRVHALVAAGIVMDHDDFEAARLELAAMDAAAVFSGDFESKHKRGFGGKFVRKLLGHHDGDGKDAGTGGSHGGGHDRLTPDREEHRQELLKRLSDPGHRGGDPFEGEDDGPTREDNVKRLRELMAKANGDEGLNENERKEHDSLSRTLAPRRSDFDDENDEPTGSTGSKLDGSEQRRYQALHDKLRAGGLSDTEREEYNRLQAKARGRKADRIYHDDDDDGYGAQAVRAFRAEAEVARQARIVMEGLAELEEFSDRETALKAASIF